ncbi:MAG: DUF6298 domain-containing protein [Bacteroidota bacterium]|nr:DUF6298 domain-containing protein [Bacteroidota bacterium]
MKRIFKTHAIAAWLFIGLVSVGTTSAALAAPPKPKPQPPLAMGDEGHLVYAPDAQGNRIPNFSYCGYKASEAPIPNVPVKVVVPVSKGDATVRIQAALDYVASLAADKDGFRGAVLLEKGTYEVSGQLKITASGVILRGSGMSENGTIVLGTGVDRQTLITISGKNNKTVAKETKIKDVYVPVNATQIHVSSPNSYKVGDMVQIHRPSTWEWIRTLKTEHFGGGITALGWKPGERDIFWDRKIVAVNGDAITLDAPLTTALDSTYGGGLIATYQWNGRISQVGVENLRCRSTYDTNNPKDEAHRWMAITIESTQDAWVRQVTFEHFAGSAVVVWETAKRVTVEDCKSLSPVSEIGGQRRYSFWTTGQQVLFQRDYAEYGFHDFAVGFCAPGPNAFVQCESHLPNSFSGGIDSWASGVLFDIVNVDGQALSFKNRGQDGQGAGWGAANSVFWQCSAARVDCYAPPTAQNWAFGIWAQFSGDGYWSDSNNSIRPRSLFYAQLYDRTGFKAKPGIQYFDMPSEASSRPSYDKAAEFIADSKEPRMLLTQFIDLSATNNPIPTDANGAKTIDKIGYKQPVTPAKAVPMHVVNGWIVRGNSVVVGNQFGEPWWKGTVRPEFTETADPAVTRYVPGRTGTGLTDDLSQVVDSMINNHVASWYRHYGLWYERRRDDHERIRRMDGEVWPPFYEQAFARSGKESAWDGLSKYDLTKYSTWYWLRLKQFADKLDEKGLVMLHNNYFQHNIIEAGAHWVDCPWRPVNNINNTPFPEPVPFAGDKRVFVAEQFYDMSNPDYRKLHQNYIRQCLNNFVDNTGVIQLTSGEYTGPFHFAKFWLQTVKDWEKETGKKEIIGISATKDVQDSILKDPEVSSVIDVIDIRYWSYRDDGSAYAPKGGLSLAPRQHASNIKVGNRSFEQTYRAVREYRDKYPEKAVMYFGDKYDSFGWAAFMAGGSLANIPAIANPQFLTEASTMKAIDLPGNPKNQWALGNNGKGFIVYNSTDEPVKLDLTKASGSFKVRFINPKTGEQLKNEESVKGGAIAEIKNPKSGAIVIWLSK